MTEPLPFELLLARDHPPTLPRLDRNPDLHRIRSGAYVDRAHWQAFAAWDRYRARVLAVAEKWRDPVFCLESAALLHGLPIFSEPRDIHLLAQQGRSWREHDVIVHRYSDDRVIVRRHGVRMTSVEDTVTDLCRVLPPAFALSLADAAARAGGKPIAVADRGRTQSDTRGVRRLDWVQERADGDAESVGESVSRAVIGWLGYEEPELQTVFTHEGYTDRVDFFWRRHGVAGESDGYGKYDLPDPEDAKKALIREKIREDRLRRHVNGFARWDWSDTVRWRPLDAKLRAAGLVPMRPAQTSMLRTLARNPRSGDSRLDRSSPR